MATHAARSLCAPREDLDRDTPGFGRPDEPPQPGVRPTRDPLDSENPHGI
jgi:hypothetical protein